MAKGNVKSVFLIHGIGGNPEGNWFPWLRRELQGMDIKVYVPQFPGEERHRLDEWMKVFDDYIKYLGEETILIGHSMGPAFILSVLESIDFPVHAAFLAAPFVGSLGNPVFDEPNKTFTEKEFDWEKIKRNCRKFYIYSSDNDPYVPLDKGQFLARKLEAEFKIIYNAGHINLAAGYRELPLLLEDIQEVL